MDQWQSIVGLIVAVGLIILFVSKRVTIYEYEKGVRYSKGLCKEILGPGRHWLFGFAQEVKRVDMRQRILTISGQEILCSDGVQLKLTLAAVYQIADPLKALNEVTSYEEMLYLNAQLAMRKAFGTVDIEQALADRNQFSEQLFSETAESVAPIGLKLISLEIKDIILPNYLKEIFTQVASAKNEGMAALEKARGETAALRSLANSAKMIESNPMLLQLRLLHTIDKSTGNTFVLNVNGDKDVVALTGSNKESEQ